MPHASPFQLNPHLTKCFSVFCSVSLGEIFSFSLSYPTRLTAALLTMRKQFGGRLLVSWLCVIQNSFSTTRK